MKSIILSVLALIPGSYLHAQQCDTLTIEQPDRVVITKSPASTHLLIEGSQKNPNYRYEERIDITDSTRVETAISDKPYSSLGLDFTILSNERHTSVIEAYLRPTMRASLAIPTGGDCIPSRWSLASGEAEIDFLGMRYNPVNPKWWIDLEWGFHYTNYLLRKGDCMLSDENGMAHLDSYPEGSKDHESSIHLAGMNMNLMFNRQLGKSSALSAGLLWKMGAPLFCRTAYTDASGHKVTKMGSFAEDMVNANRFGLRLEYRFWDTCSLNIDYMFNDAFKSGNSFQLPRLSIGLGVHF